MLDAPRHDWNYYAERCREADEARWRRLTPQEKFALYSDMFNVVRAARGQDQAADWSRADDAAWNEKLSLRRCLVEAFAKMDARRDEATPRKDAD